MKKAIFNVSALSALFVPAVALAQNTPNFTYVDNIVRKGTDYLQLSITIITILITVYFLWNVLRFVMAKDPADQTAYKKAMINGLIGLFVATAVWGIIRLAGNLTGVDTTRTSPDLTCPPGLVYDPQIGTCGTSRRMF